VQNGLVSPEIDTATKRRTVVFQYLSWSLYVVINIKLSVESNGIEFRPGTLEENAINPLKMNQPKAN
jgi:hypothetical protein